MGVVGMPEDHHSDGESSEDSAGGRRRSANGDRKEPGSEGRAPRGRQASSARPRRDEGTGRPRRDDGTPRPRRDGGAVGSRVAGERRTRTEGAPTRGARTGARSPQRPSHRDAGAASRGRAADVESRKSRHDDPEIPEEVTPQQLDRVARAELKTLSKDNAEGVARHLVMAGRLIDDDPALAHRHALAAGRRAGRVAVVRETVAITAYATGDFALALRELRTYRRLSGRNDQLPLMVDSERGVGRPERALELGRSVPRTELDVPVRVSLAVAMSGARLDLGQPELALHELEIPQLDPDHVFSWSPALFDAYATVLEELGRMDDARRWYAFSERASAALNPGDELIELEVEDDDPAS